MNVPTVKARSQFADMVNRAAYGKERVLLTRWGKKVAAMVPIEDVETLDALEELMDIKDARKALKEAKRKGSISLEELRKKLGFA
ncbi:MAG: type II toxin-antitoxin system Phd/YefM family antitoxin [Nitrospinae bacterium]|nr:type II toxin-antitoxin system Phd/YefM family antitoxin [Nitrospinota bacterium]